MDYPIVLKYVDATHKVESTINKTEDNRIVLSLVVSDNADKEIKTYLDEEQNVNAALTSMIEVFQRLNNFLSNEEVIGHTLSVQKLSDDISNLILTQGINKFLFTEISLRTNVSLNGFTNNYKHFKVISPERETELQIATTQGLHKIIPNKVLPLEVDSVISNNAHATSPTRVILLFF